MRFLWETPDLLTSRGYIKCFRCKKQKSLKRLRKELLVILCFVEQRPAYQVSLEYHLSYPAVRIFETSGFFSIINASWKAENSPETLEIDDAYFGGKRKGKKGPGRRRKKCGIGHVGERRQGIYQSSGDADSSPFNGGHQI